MDQAMPNDPQNGDHIVRSFDDELANLSILISRMGGMAESQLASAMTAVVQRDSNLAERVIEHDRSLDDLDAEVDVRATRLLALRQPMAVDLRAVMAGLRISGDIERIGDYAKNLAKRAIVLNQNPPAGTVAGVGRMGALVRQRVKDVLDAYANKDVPLAIAVWEGDAEIDQLYNSLFRELLTYMMEDPRTITVGTHLLFIAKNLERIGDLATNIAEQIHFQVTGHRLEDDRPKGDETPMLAAPPDRITEEREGGRD
jgi:phosphate transport system protein